MNWTPITILIQVGLCAAMICTVLYMQKRRLKPTREQVKPKQSAQEMQNIARMRARRLNVPLCEMTRPATFEDIVGQEEGIRALKAALCGPNPQHVLIYGPPGIGKTCAARLVLEEAKKRQDSPFGPESKFVEMDATCVRFDERAIADPLIGSVHDPIYQGAGALGTQGIPQPKPGAVTRAHCGILFLDEIGELHPMQMNKLLKVLEDRYVRFESAYYSPENSGIPQHIHDIFQNGLPADFRLVGATTRKPEDLPPALRSRCMELYFKPLAQKELEKVACGAAERAGYTLDEGVVYRCGLHAQSGRDVVNIVQLACGIAHDDGRTNICREDVEWVARTCHYIPRIENHISSRARVGVSNALAVAGSGLGLVMEIECIISKGKGKLTLNGLVEEEEINLRDRKLKRKGTARCSVENVLAAFREVLREDLSVYDISINVPGGMPVDGPSAGVAIVIALLSARLNRPSDDLVASTGEITMTGEVRPVGGVREKVQAAVAAGATRVLVPVANWEDSFSSIPVEIIPVAHLTEVVRYAFSKKASAPTAVSAISNQEETNAAAQAESEQEALSAAGEA